MVRRKTNHRKENPGEKKEPKTVEKNETPVEEKKGVKTPEKPAKHHRKSGKRTEKKTEQKQVNPTYVLAGIAVIALVVGIAIGVGIGHGGKAGTVATLSKPVAYIITSPVCSVCNQTLDQGISFLKSQYGFSDKEFKIVKLSYSDKKAKEIYSEIIQKNPAVEYLPTIVLEGNIDGTTLYKKIKAFAESRHIPLQNIIQPAGKYYVLAPVALTYRYDPSKPVEKFYIYTNNPQQLYRLAGQIMSIQQNLVVEFKPASGDYVMKLEGPQEIIDKIKPYFPTAEVEGNTIVVPKIKVSLEAQKPVLDQVKEYLQQNIGMGADINAVALPSTSKYFVIVKGPKNVLENVIPPEWNYDGKEYYVLKSNRPEVDIFVMSYCPFGLQAEKAILPVIRLLGNSVNFHVRFVSYSMHGNKELIENSRQYCIQEMDANKYLNYLSCFTETGDASKCMAQAGINEKDINACISKLNKEYNIMENAKNFAGMFPPYPLEKQLNENYHVQGSPTLVIQFVPMGSTPRNPEALKELICAAFINPPKACKEQLSSQNTAPGIGGESGTAATGSCG